MDFSYEYTAEQGAFRADVVEWLDRNAPADGSALFDSPDDSDALRELTLRLGHVGWLAPSEPERNGGAGLSADLTVVALEELNRRGLLGLVEDEAQALRTALTVWDARPDTNRIRSLATGALTTWKHAVALSPATDGGARLDLDSVGVEAEPDADGYILNGAARFTGAADRPDILWTVALVKPAAAVCLLVDVTTDGILCPARRALTSTAPRIVKFEDVWVLKTDALGDEGDGHRVLSTRVSLDPRADLPSWVERDTDALIEFARKDGISQDPIRARMLVEAYIASRVSRLLRMRASFVERDGASDGSTQAAALSALWRRQTATALADTAGQVVGPRGMLSAGDPRAVDGGRYERLGRRELAEREAGDAEREGLVTDLLDS